MLTNRFGNYNKIFSVCINISKSKLLYYKFNRDVENDKNEEFELLLQYLSSSCL